MHIKSKKNKLFLKKRKLIKPLGYIFVIGVLYAIYLTFSRKRVKSDLLAIIPTQNFHINQVTVILKLQNNCKNCLIKYTLDGSLPSTNSNDFLTPLVLNETTTIRAAVFDGQNKITDISNKTYFINESSTLPIISLITDPKNFFDPDIGIYTLGNDHNYDKKGPDWERPIHVEYFTADKTEAFALNLKTKLHGRTTRKTDQKSLKLCGDEKYGATEINYKIFSQIDTTIFKCVVLRNSGNDWSQTYIRDPLMHSLVEDLDIDTSAYQPVVVYLNGQYWGIQNLRELTDENYIANKYNIDAKDITILTHKNGPLFEDKGYPELVHGSEKQQKEYLKLIDYAAEHSPSLRNNYDYILSQIDVDNFIEYHAVEMYFGNNDWPHANIDFWRYEQEFYSPQSIKQLDGRWRWILYDTDAGFALYSGNFIRKSVIPIADNDMTRKIDKHEFRFQRLFERRSFVNKFLNKYADLLNTNFKTEKVIKEINIIASNIEGEIPRHADRWKDSLDSWSEHPFQNLNEWQENIEYLREYARQRPDHVYEHLSNYFQLKGVSKLIIETNIPEAGKININSIALDQSQFPWAGYYFDTIPFKISVSPSKDYKFIRWEGDIDSSDKELTLEIKEETTIKAIFEKKNTFFF